MTTQLLKIISNNKPTGYTTINELSFKILRRLHTY